MTRVDGQLREGGDGEEQQPYEETERAQWRALASGGVLNLGGAALAAAANVLLVLLVTRHTPPAQAGALFAATSLFLIAATIARLGTTTGLVYWVARLRALGRHADVDRCLRLALVPVAVTGLLSSGVLLLAAPALGRLVDAGESTFAVDYLRGLALLLPAAAIADACLAATRGLGNMRPTVVVEKVLRPALQLVATGVVILLAVPQWLALAWGGPYLAAVLVASGWLGVLLRRQSPGPATSSPTLRGREFWGFTLPRAGSTLVQLALQRLDIVLVAALRGPADAAIYTAATRFLVVGQLGNQAVSTAIQPRLSALLAVEDREAAGRVYQVATGWLVLATWPVYLLCLTFPSELVSWFGRDYGAGGVVVVVLAVTMLVATACGMVDTMLNMAGRTSWTLLNSTSALATMVVADLLLVPPLGVLGAALGWSAAILVNNLVPLTQLRVAYGLHPFGRETRRAVLCGLALGALPPVLALAGASVPVRLLAVVVGSIALAGGAWRSRHLLALDAFPIPERSGARRRRSAALVGRS